MRVPAARRLDAVNVPANRASWRLKRAAALLGPRHERNLPISTAAVNGQRLAELRFLADNGWQAPGKHLTLGKSTLTIGSMLSAFSPLSPKSACNESAAYGHP